MHHIHITRAKVVEFLQSCEALEGFISSDSILGRLMIAMRAALVADGVSVDVWQGDTSIPKNNHVEELELPSGVHMILTRALEATGRK